MSVALGATTVGAAVSQTGHGGGSAVALQAQLDRCTKQLGDWVDCSSGKTPEGKQIIEALQEKISSIRQQIQNSQTQPGANPGTVGGPPASLALASIGSVGTVLNTVA
jgi:hypothetical protein